MLETLLPNTATLKKYVKGNKSMPDDSWLPFVPDAAEMMRPYLGDALMVQLGGEGTDEKLLEAVRRPLAIFTMLLATDENSINVGGTGHTVARDEKFAPASDTKISAYKRSLAARGWQAMEALLRHLDAAKITEGRPSLKHYLRSAQEFQEKGMVGIGYNRLTYQHLCDMMLAVEGNELTALIGVELATRLHERKEADENLLTLVQRYVANKSAALLLEEKAKRTYEPLDYEPVISMLPYGAQADQYEAKIVAEINSDYAGYGFSEPIGGALDFNSKDKKIFYGGC